VKWHYHAKHKLEIGTPLIGSSVSIPNSPVALIDFADLNDRARSEEGAASINGNDRWMVRQKWTAGQRAHQ
jgi:hypothetical protein